MNSANNQIKINLIIARNNYLISNFREKKIKNGDN